jgi:hypothetical protein
MRRISSARPCRKRQLSGGQFFCSKDRKGSSTIAWTPSFNVGTACHRGPSCLAVGDGAISWRWDQSAGRPWTARSGSSRTAAVPTRGPCIDIAPAPALDVVADILPPPMYLIELRLVLSQAVEGTLAPAKGTAEFKRLQREYTDRANRRTTNPPFGLESKLLGE